MHLALAIGGCTLDELDARMTEHEFLLWDKFDKELILPARRATLQSASIARWVAMTMGGVKQSATVNDFVLVPIAPSADDSVNAEIGSAIVSAATAARVHRLGQGRKAKG